jgi:hypothetical protein
MQADGSHCKTDLRFDDACALLERILTGSGRDDILSEAMKTSKPADVYARLRNGMRSNTFKTSGRSIQLDPLIRKYDSRTQQDGFHILRDWDGKASKLMEEIIPVDVLQYFSGLPTAARISRKHLGILLDYYFIYVLALLAMRAWDEGQPDANFDRITVLLKHLQDTGSGMRFADNAEMLVFIATSHFEPDDRSYDRLLDRVRTLNEEHRSNFARLSAAVLGSHLRFGFQAFYKRDIALLREDNVADYPWLCFSVATLMKTYARLHDQHVHNIERDSAVEGILNGLTPDPRAFLGKPPASFAPSQADLDAFHHLFTRYKDDLIQEFESHRPSSQAYSPIAFNFNFPHNLLKGMMVNALTRENFPNIPVNDLLTSFPRTPETQFQRETLLNYLMQDAGLSPEILKSGKEALVIHYDIHAGLRNFVKTMATIREFVR